MNSAEIYHAQPRKDPRLYILQFSREPHKENNYFKRAAQVLENERSGNYFDCKEVRNQEKIFVAELTEETVHKT
jgi:fatty acid/phospholipid biosynthesis enzyme